MEGEEECDAGLLGSEDTDACCDENCKLRPTARCSDKNSPCCIGCNFMSVGAKCRQENYATCEESAACTGEKAECPKSLPMPDGTSCIERGKCKAGECIPYCETQGLQSCMCDTKMDACMRCCRQNLNSTCFPIMDEQGNPDPLKDGTPCYQGSCNKVSNFCAKPCRAMTNFVFVMILLRAAPCQAVPRRDRLCNDFLNFFLGSM